MNKRLDGKVVLITGATSGIGRATAEYFAGEGASVAIIGRRAEQGKDVLSAIHQAGARGIFVQGSVADAVTCETAVARTMAEFGHLDIAFNCAGISPAWSPLADIKEKDFDEVIAINLKGVFLSMKYEIPAMIKSGGGSIINASSVAGLVGSPNLSGYTASKHGINGMTKAAALEYASQGIRVNSISLGLVQTEIVDALSEEQKKAILAYHPIGRTGSLAEVAETVLFLGLSGSGFITGAVISVDGGVVAQ